MPDPTAAPSPVQSPQGNSFAKVVTPSGATVETNAETQDALETNLLESEELTPDGEPTQTKDQKERKAKEAAAELGKRGGEASAKKRAEAVEEEGDTDSDEEDDKALSKKARHDPVARMKLATRKEAAAKKQAADAERALAEERASRQALEERLARLERGERPESVPRREPANGKPPQEEAPKEEDFDNYRDFVRATAKHEAKQELQREFQEREQKEKVRTQAQKAADHVKSAVESFRSRTEEATKGSEEAYAKVLEVAGQLESSIGIPPNQRHLIRAHHAFADELLGHPNGPRMMLYLADHPDELQRLATLETNDMRDVIREVVRLELASAANPGQPAPARVAVSQAPPPIRPVAGAPPVASDTERMYSENVSGDEYYDLRRAELLRQRRVS